MDMHPKEILLFTPTSLMCLLVLKCMSELVSVILVLGSVICYLPKEYFCCFDFGTDAAYPLGASLMYLLSLVNCIFITGVEGRTFVGFGFFRLIVSDPIIRVISKGAILSACVFISGYCTANLWMFSESCSRLRLGLSMRWWRVILRLYLWTILSKVFIPATPASVCLTAH